MTTPSGLFRFMYSPLPLYNPTGGSALTIIAPCIPRIPRKAARTQYHQHVACPAAASAYHAPERCLHPRARLSRLRHPLLQPHARGAHRAELPRREIVSAHAISQSATPNLIRRSPLFVTWNKREGREWHLRGVHRQLLPDAVHDGLAEYALVSAFRDTALPQDRAQRARAPAVRRFAPHRLRACGVVPRRDRRRAWDQHNIPASLTAREALRPRRHRPPLRRRVSRRCHPAIHSAHATSLKSCPNKAGTSSRPSTARFTRPGGAGASQRTCAAA